MKYKISIIVTVYNTEKYIKKCLNSIINQTIDIENLQVIVVDDASTDDSSEIIKKYVSRYDNFEYYSLEKRSGTAGKPRNLALQKVKGKYIMFIDSDDFYEEDACEKLFDEIEDLEVDMITANYINSDEAGKVWGDPIYDVDLYPSYRFSTANYTKSLHNICSSVWVKIFRSSFIKNNDIKFLEHVPAEDAYFTFSVLLKTDRIAYIQNVIYCYRQRNNEDISVSNNCSYKYFKRINIAYKKIYKLFLEADRLDLYRYFYSKHQTYMLFKLIDSTLMNDRERIQTLRHMRWYFSLGKDLNIKPALASLKYLIRRICLKDYDVANEMIKMLYENRQYIDKNVKSKLLKPLIEYEADY